MHATLIPIGTVEMTLAAALVEAIDALLAVMAFRAETARSGYREMIDTLRWEEI